MNVALAIFVIVLSLLAAAFFAAAETALTAASRARLQALETSGDARAARKSPRLRAVGPPGTP